MTILPRLMLMTGVLFLGACSSQKTELRAAVVPSHAAAMAEFFGLVDVSKCIPDVVVDLRYAARDNIVRHAVYPPDMPCLLKASTAEKLKQAQAILRTKRLGLRIWDAWRPPEVQVLLVEKEGNTGLFMDPKSAWSRHCSGTAVDVTLVDERGVEQQMPTYHDEGGPRASYHYTGRNHKIQRNLYLLQRAMVDVGFRILDTEWWHFDDADYYITPAPVVFGNEIGIRISDVQ